MKWNEQANYAASTGNRMMGLLKNAFVSRDKRIWKRLYTTYIRPHLEFAIQAWCPYEKRDIKALESVQRRVTRIPACLKGKDYPYRCKLMGIEPLSERRTRGDLIEMFKLYKGLESVRWASEFKKSNPRGVRRSQLRREVVKNN